MRQEDDLRDSNVLSMRDRLLPGVRSDQETPGPDQEDGRGGQEETLTNAMPGPSSGENLSTVETDEDDLPDSRSQDRGQEGQEMDGQGYVGSGHDDGSHLEDTAGSSSSLACGREYHVMRTERVDLLDSNGLDMEGNQEEDVPDSLNTTRTCQDRSQEGPGRETNIAMPEPSYSHAEHQATGMTERQDVDLVDTREVP